MVLVFKSDMSHTCAHSVQINVSVITLTTYITVVIMYTYMLQVGTDMTCNRHFVRLFMGKAVVVYSLMVYVHLQQYLCC